MAIEIKELSIQVKIMDEDKPLHSQNGISKRELETYMDYMIKECTHKVIEHLKEKEER
jgi:hypothetical protein